MYAIFFKEQYTFIYLVSLLYFGQQVKHPQLKIMLNTQKNHILHHVDDTLTVTLCFSQSLNK